MLLAFTALVLAIEQLRLITIMICLSTESVFLVTCNLSVFVVSFTEPVYTGSSLGAQVRHLSGFASDLQC